MSDFGLASHSKFKQSTKTAPGGTLSHKTFVLRKGSHRTITLRFFVYVFISRKINPPAISWFVRMEIFI